MKTDEYFDTARYCNRALTRVRDTLRLPASRRQPVPLGQAEWLRPVLAWIEQEVDAAHSSGWTLEEDEGQVYLARWARRPPASVVVRDDGARTTMQEGEIRHLGCRSPSLPKLPGGWIWKQISDPVCGAPMFRLTRVKQRGEPPCRGPVWRPKSSTNYWDYWERPFPCPKVEEKEKSILSSDELDDLTVRMLVGLWRREDEFECIEPYWQMRLELCRLRSAQLRAMKSRWKQLDAHRWDEDMGRTNVWDIFYLGCD